MTSAIPTEVLDRAPRIGPLPSLPIWDQALPETVALFDRVATALARAGAAVSEREMPASIAALTTAHPVVMNHESASRARLGTGRGARPDQRRPARTTGLRLWPAPLRRSPMPTSCSPMHRRRFLPRPPGSMCSRTPSGPGRAPAGLAWTGDPAFNSVWTSLHVPCVTVPAGEGPDGLPLGIQIIGRIGEDRAALAWAQRGRCGDRLARASSNAALTFASLLAVRSTAILQ